MTAQRPQPPTRPTLDDVHGARVAVRRFCARLFEFQKAAPGQFPSQRGKDKALYYALKNIRSSYRGIQGPELTADEGRLLAAFPEIFGKDALGSVAKVVVQASGVVLWRWTFESSGYPIHGDDFDTEQEATAELRVVQSKLYPGWERAGQRQQHLERLRAVVKEERQKAQILREPTLQAFVGHAVTPVEDFRLEGEALRNAFPGFRNLGNTCYLNAVARCP